jgi:hypothetical protein
MQWGFSKKGAEDPVILHPTSKAGLDLPALSYFIILHPLWFTIGEALGRFASTLF